MVKLNDELCPIEIVIDDILSSMKYNTTNKRILSKANVKEKFMLDEFELYISMKDRTEDKILPTLFNSLEEDNKKLKEELKVDKNFVNLLYNDHLKRSLFVPSLNHINGCPICDSPLSNTLDHYLPKERFLSFAITPINLVPLCSQCNNKKGVYFCNSKMKSPFHPYFEDYDFKDVVKVSIIIDDKIELNIKVKDDCEKYERYRLNYEDIYKLGFQYDILAARCYDSFVEFLASKEIPIEKSDLKSLIKSKFSKIEAHERKFFNEIFITYIVFQELYNQYNDNIYNALMAQVEERIRARKIDFMESKLL